MKLIPGRARGSRAAHGDRNGTSRNGWGTTAWEVLAERSSVRASSVSSPSRAGRWAEPSVGPCRSSREPGAQGRRDKKAEWIRQGFLRLPELTERELQMFHAMAYGPSNDELAADLGMSVRAVKFHLENMRGKLGGISRVQTCLLAARHHMGNRSAGHGCRHARCTH
ncbi:response regulator transcription factor [Streptomyces sp. NPDC002104]